MVKNKIKTKELSEEIQQEMSESVEEKVEETQSFLKGFFSRPSLSAYSISKNLPFIAFLAILGLVYISNRHLAERTIRSIDKYTREVKEMSWDYKSLNAELMKLTTQSEVAKRADSLGLEERRQPAIKLVIDKKEIK